MQSHAFDSSYFAVQFDHVFSEFDSRFFCWVHPELQPLLSVARAVVWPHRLRGPATARAFFFRPGLLHPRGCGRGFSPVAWRRPASSLLFPGPGTPPPTDFHLMRDFARAVVGGGGGWPFFPASIWPPEPSLRGSSRNVLLAAHTAAAGGALPGPRLSPGHAAQGRPPPQRPGPAGWPPLRDPAGTLLLQSDFCLRKRVWGGGGGGGWSASSL